MSSTPLVPRPIAQQRRGMAMASLVIGILSVPTAGLLLVGAVLSIVFGIVALVKANREPAEYGGKGLAIGGIVCGALSIVLIPVLGIIAAIAIPSLLRARVSANEAATMGDVRTVISAEVAYQSAYGHYDRLECLAAPTSCAPGREGAPSFLDAELARAEIKTGYRRSFHPGPTLAETGASAASGSATTSFAYVAEPRELNRTGVRAFCGDSRGIICFTFGSMPEISGGQCPESCEPLR